MGTGYLIVQLSTALRAMPVIEASINITSKKDPSFMYKRDGELNLSGKIGPIELEAPNKQLSFKPQENGTLPYSEYDIKVNANSFKDVVIEGIKIFDGVTSIQEIAMTSLTFTLFKSTPSNIVIPEHQLVLKEEKNFKNISKEEILPLKLFKDVFIPESIIVHLGEENEPADDVIVKFTDYIKNVCANEIYPTWPEEAIRANVYAQISFALNLVYIEWYGRKGYPYQITNSIKYDQAFVYGGNTFNTTNTIVEAIFNEYISLVSSDAPYFSQSCNNKIDKCRGLSKWGSVYLANEGKSAKDIIQYYYGIGKIIEETSILEGIPESYPGYELKLNDIDENVKIMQLHLNIISQVYKEIPKIENPNGEFFEDTLRTVESFQRVFNLLDDGIIGKSTWYKISEIYIAITRLSEVKREEELNIEEDIYSGKYPGYILGYGDTGEDVEELQTYLQRISRYYDIPASIVDGSLGSYTLLSVTEFQKLFDLTPDGLVNLSTWEKIYEVYSRLPKDEDFDGVYPGEVLQYGSSDNKVFEFQGYLREIAKYNNIPDLRLTGLFDEPTVLTVKEFQRLFKLEPNGIVDEVTWNKIYDVYMQYPRTIKTNDIIEYPGYVLREGMNGIDIKNLQTLLKFIGKLYDSVDEIIVSGVFDEATKKSVISFQKYFGLKESGQVGINTWRYMIAIYKDLAAQKNVNIPKMLYNYPGIILKVGVNNAYVAVLKEYINVLSKNGYNLDELFVDSVFDGKTESEVKKFQKIEGLEETGEVDTITWNKLAIKYSELYLGVGTRDKRKYKHRRK